MRVYLWKTWRCMMVNSPRWQRFPLLTMKLPLARTDSAHVMFPSAGQGEIRQTDTQQGQLGLRRG